MMDPESRKRLAGLLRDRRVAALGTLADGTPLVTLVAFAAAADFGAFYIHVSRLAQHTRGLAADPRVSLMVAEPDTGRGNPQTLARISIRGGAAFLAAPSDDFEAAKEIYLRKFPQAAFNFTLGDFSLCRITPVAARFVSGFGKIFDLSAEDLRAAAGAF